MCEYLTTRNRQIGATIPMFEFLKRRKRTIVEKIVDRARGTITKQRNHHLRQFRLYESAARQALDAMHHHKATYRALDEKLAALDDVPKPLATEQLAAFDELTADDFGLGEELAEDDAAILADMGDGRAATESDTLAKIESANVERVSHPIPIEQADTPGVDEPPRKPKRPRKPRAGKLVPAMQGMR
jgi:hypothetical protein